MYLNKQLSIASLLPLLPSHNTLYTTNASFSSFPYLLLILSKALYSEHMSGSAVNFNKI